MSSDILSQKDYKDSVERLESAIREHHALLERYGNEAYPENQDISVVSGWVLVIGTTGMSSETGEFHDAMVETPPSQNNFMSVGLAQYGAGFTLAQIANYTIVEDD